MLVTAAQIMAELPPEKERTYPANRRSRLLPEQPCRNAFRGCQGSTKEKRTGHGWCARCYDRRRRYGNSWHHSPYLSKCTKANCFMRGTAGHP